MLLAATGLGAAEDALPSWKDGPAKQSIVDFVAKVTKEGAPDFVPPAERIAVFDNDGTLWSEQPMYFQLAFVPQPEQLRWLAVATDGWRAELLEQLAEPRPALALQRWLNVQSQQRGQFDDDGAVAIWHKEIMNCE